MTDQRMRRRVLRMLAAAGTASALPFRLDAADRAPAPGTMDYCATPSRFDQPLHVPGREGLQGLLRTNSDVLLLEAVKRASSSPGLALAASAAGREYVDPSLIIQRGAP